MTIEAVQHRVQDIVAHIFSPFFDGGDFSWKKCMTGSITVVFCYACIGFLHKHNYDALPQEYMWIIAGVFAAYFMKDLPQGIVDVLTKYFENKIPTQPKT